MPVPPGPPADWTVKKNFLKGNDPWAVYRKGKGKIFKTAGRGVCFDFQSLAGCTKDTCGLEHVCGKCGGNHAFSSGQC